MSLAQYEINQPPTTDTGIQLELRRRAERIAMLEGENAEVRQENERLEKERCLFFSLLSNEALLPAERIVGVFTVFAMEYERSQGTAIADYAAATVAAIATQAGVGSDAAGKAIDNLGKFGAWKKERIRPEWDEEKKQWTSGVAIKAPGSSIERLQRIAHLRPTSEERKALTGKSKPGSQPGEKREKIDRTCPSCGSKNTSLWCLDCEEATHTDDLLKPSHDEEIGKPQVAGQYSKKQTATCGLPPVNHSPPERDEIPDPLRVYSAMNEARDRRSAALLAAAGGIPIFPCHTVTSEGACSCRNPDCSDPGKHPWGVPNGFQAATTDRETIEYWWNAHPTANIGIWTGAAGWIVIDVDTEGLEDWRALAERHQLPRTLTARSGSGGYHYIYGAPDGVTIGNGTGTLPPGIHVRGAGGYIIAAPSLHQSGKRYTWADIQPIVPLPDPLRAILQPTPPAPRAPLRSAQRGTFYTTGTPIYAGSRNQELAKVAGGMARRGATGDHLEDLIAETNQNRCTPPLPDAEARKIARSIDAKERRKGGSGL